jgi:hypothetical protein
MNFLEKISPLIRSWAISNRAGRCNSATFASDLIRKCVEKKGSEG